MNFYVLLLPWIYHILAVTFANSGQLKEYCFSETFNPVCQEHEVVVMQSAVYGQMRLGRCVDESYGYLGCSADILDQMDKKCSGRRQCEIIITSISAELNCTIPKTFVRYMEAMYTCQAVLEPRNGNCELQTKSRKVQLTSDSTLTHGCGEDSNPWIIQAKPGQKINISMIDFSWNPVHTNLRGCLQKYGHIIDMNENTVTDICGKTKREKHLLLSNGNLLQVTFDKAILQDTNFILTFQAVGCPTFESPPDTWTKEDNGVVTVGCVHNDNKWKMRCIGNHWIGILGKCEKEENTKTKEVVESSDQDKVFGMPPVIGFSLIGAIFLVILCVMLTTILGYFCIRKSKSPQKEYYLAPMTYNPTQGLNYPTIRSSNNMNHQHQTLLLNPAQPGQQTLRTNTGHNDHIQDTGSSPHYFVLENRTEDQKEPIYDAVYQNVTDGNNV